MREKDLTNVAYTDDYLNKREKMIAAVIRPENVTDTETIAAEGEYSRTVICYGTMVDGLRYSCSHNKVYDQNGMLIHEYTSLYDHSFFCTPVTHSDGRRYLAYKEDLYGYSVLNLETKETFRYIPAESWNSGETFIVTDIVCNPENDIIAAGGCYWACPTGTFLFEVKDPMKQFNRYLDLQTILGEYDKYDDIEFQEWEGSDILLKGYNIEQEPYHNEIIKVTRAEYENALHI